MTSHPFGPVVNLPWEDDRYDPDPPRLRWHVDLPCGHGRCKGYTTCRVERSIAEPVPTWEPVQPEGRIEDE